MVKRKEHLKALKFLLPVFLFSFLIVHSLILEGAYLRNFPVTVVQPNGEKAHLFASGDEFYNWLHDKNGYTVIRNARTGYYVYAIEKEGDLLPSKFAVTPDYFANRANVNQLNIPKYLKHSPEKRKSPTKLFPEGSPANVEKIIKAPLTGTINNVVIFIRFSDESEFTDSISTYNAMFNDITPGANSMYNYFNEATYNQLGITTTFYPTATTTVVSYQDSQPRAYYQPYDETTNPTGYQDEDESRDREFALLKNAVDGVSSQIPSGLNVDGDGRVDNVCFIVSGSPDGWSDLLWPHMWSLYGETAYINGKRVWTFNLQLQNSLKSSGVGVLCHEMFHSLGAPDLYHYSYDGLSPVYKWDLMEWNLNPPQHMGAYMKYRYGTWMSSIPEITSAGTYALNPLTSSTDNCYKIASPYSSSEYFVVEYRRKSGTFENSLPGEGLLVYRINSNKDGEGNADGPPDEVYIYRPDGTTNQNGTPASANFSSDAGRTAINDTTNPSSFLASGGLGGLNISNISSVNGTMSFDVSFSQPPTDLPVISLNRNRLNFAYVIGGSLPESQTFSISNSGEGTLNWTVTGDISQPISGTGNAVVTINVDPTGYEAGTYTGTLYVSDPNATNSPQTVNIYLNVYASGATSGPFGVFSTPTDGSSVSSSIPVTGWALDDVGMESVKIYRQEGGGLIYIGDAMFVEGARPDVEQAYPDYPNNHKAGWGYMLLTNFLPNSGNGTFPLQAWATDKEGNSVHLGTKTITCDNANAIKPFGAIDTPSQGGTASGSAFVNFGWTLTPMPNSIPTDGSTLDVYVDGVSLGHPVYNQYRPDIANNFPGYANSDGAVGYFYLDTTAYTNGVHTIFWTATDSAGNADGIGSRYFSVQNTGSSANAQGQGKSQRKDLDIPLSFEFVMNLPINYDPIRYKRGFKTDIDPEIAVTDNYGVTNIEIREVERIEILLNHELSAISYETSATSYSGYMVVGTELRPLPIGSTLDTENGIFSWLPGPGFFGVYDLVFIKEDRNGVQQKISVWIRIIPKFDL